MELLNKKKEANTEQLTTEGKINTFSFFFNLINNQPLFINESILRAWMEGKYDDNGYLTTIDQRGTKQRVTKLNGELIQPPSFQRALRLDGEQAELVVELLKLTKGQDVPDEVKENLKKFVFQNDQRALGRMREVALMINQEALGERVEDFVKKYGRIREDLEFQKKFYDLYSKNESLSVLLAHLGSYDEKEVGDLVLTQKLRVLVFAKRREETLRSLTTQGPNLNIDTALVQLNELAKSPVMEDKKAATEAAKILYNLEIGRFKNEAFEKLKLDANPAEIRQFFEGLPIRPSIGEIDYVAIQTQLKEDVAKQLEEILKNKRLKTAYQIRESFSRLPVDDVLTTINKFSDDTIEDLSIKAQLFDLYKSYLAANNQKVFDERFAQELSAKIEAQLKEKFNKPELGKNKEAFNYIRERFVSTIYPLVESFREDPRTKESVEEYLGSRLNFVQRLKALEEQRLLTDTERAYLESVELLSVFNPYLVAVASAEFGVTNEFLSHHFEKLSQKTISELKERDYVPLIQIGLGPDGLAAQGEIARNNPELVRQMLVIDAGERPGGPFAIPGGPAWELNSANRRGTSIPKLPEKPDGEELKTVRAYGSPFRWYPGERSDQGKDVRQGSINRTVDYLISPDDLSTARYPTNEELQITIALQAALLVNKLALKTRLIKVEKNPNPQEEGDKIVTLEITGPDEKVKNLKLRTDAIFNGTGLGEASFGFKLQGSRAEKVMRETRDTKGFPKISTTLEAFKALADRRKTKLSPGETLVIYGSGNSADTLIEFIGNIFQGENPKVRDVTKIYIVSESELSSRPRYALINDLKPRNGRGNLIEQIRGRVSDIDFANKEGDPSTRKVVFYGRDGKLITNGGGMPIEADAGISATGFRPQIDAIFSEYANGKSLLVEGVNSAVEPLTLPTNSEVAVADVLKNDPNVLFLGTASKPRFDSLEKLAQLPPDAREALLRNGAENAVAIGFRAPDTQAAVNIWLNSKEINLEPVQEKPRSKIFIEGEIFMGTKYEIKQKLSQEDVRIPNNVSSETLLLSPLLSYLIGNQVEVFTGPSSEFSGEVGFVLGYDRAKSQFTLTFDGGDILGVSQEFFREVINACKDEYFQRYTLSLLEKRRRDPKLQLNIAFKKGKMDPNNTFVQEI